MWLGEGPLEHGGWRQETHGSSRRASEGGEARTESMGRTELAEEELGPVCSQKERVLMHTVNADQRSVGIPGFGEGIGSDGAGLCVKL